MITSWKKLAALLPAAFIATALHAGTVVTTDDSKVPDDAVAPQQASIYDKIWGLTKIYRDDTNPVIEEFDFTGRFQMDYYHVSSNRGDRDYFEIRRLRLGEDTFWANRFIEIKAELDTNLHTFGNDSVFYYRMTDLFVRLNFSDAFKVTLGKQQPHFGYDREADPLSLVFERSFFDDAFFLGNDYETAATISGKIGNFGYIASVISDDVEKEFGKFNGGASYFAQVSYDFSKALHSDKATWYVDYLHTDPNKNSNVFQNFSNGIVTYFDYQKGRFGLVTQFGYGAGIGSKSDIYEIMLVPTFYVTEKLQLVGRYQLGFASQDNGIATLNRQEKTIGKFTGDTYNAPYLGLDYYLYGHKLKLMAGVQYGDLSGGTGPKAGYSGWTSLVGIRVFW